MSFYEINYSRRITSRYSVHTVTAFLWKHENYHVGTYRLWYFSTCLCHASSRARKYLAQSGYSESICSAVLTISSIYLFSPNIQILKWQLKNTNQLGIPSASFPPYQAIISLSSVRSATPKICSMKYWLWVGKWVLSSKYVNTCLWNRNIFWALELLSLFNIHTYIVYIMVDGLKCI